MNFKKIITKNLLKIIFFSHKQICNDFESILEAKYFGQKTQMFNVCLKKYIIFKTTSTEVKLMY